MEFDCKSVILAFASIGIGRQSIILRKVWNLKVTEFDSIGNRGGICKVRSLAVKITVVDLTFTVD